MLLNEHPSQNAKRKFRKNIAGKKTFTAFFLKMFEGQIFNF